MSGQREGTQKEGSSRRDFIRRMMSGAFGMTLAGIPGLDKIFAKKKSSKVVSRVAFGSCASQERHQPIWDAIVSKDPDLFLFIGDNIYADTENMDVMRKKYNKLAIKPGYQRLRKTCPVLSTWDDHDYGKNDAGAGYSKKKESEEIFMDFFDVPQDSPRRRRPGIYGAQMFGPPDRRVQVILLDTRYFKDTSGRKRNRMGEDEKEEQNLVGWYLPTEDPEATILGESQWKWLEEQLQKEADLRIIASSIQVVAYEKGMECWGNYPHERNRLFGLIEKTGANGVIFISGDVHFSEVSMANEGLYPLYDFTSSGMTHANKEWAQAVNSFRLGKAYAGHNTGLILIDWEQEDPLIRLQTLAQDGIAVIQHTIRLSQIYHQ